MNRVCLGGTLLLALTLAAAGCRPEKKSLPILGERDVVTKTVDGRTVVDTVYHRVPDFSFTNQHGQPVTARDFDGKIYVADFFFTTCPTICPIMKTQMLRVYERFKEHPEVALLSHSIDPRHDSVAVLREYAQRLGVTGTQWQFVTGEKADIYEIGQRSYYVTAKEDPDAAGGLLHSGAFILVDKQKRIRGMYDGTKADKVDELMADMERLLSEGK
jgi:protein SCO1/2